MVFRVLRFAQTCSRSVSSRVARTSGILGCVGVSGVTGGVDLPELSGTPIWGCSGLYELRPGPPTGPITDLAFSVWARVGVVHH